MAAVQVETWRTCYAPRLPEGALDALDETLVEAGWRAAVSSPPSPRHRLLVALAAGRLAGYVAVGPAEDGDSTSIDGEIYTLTVAPADQRLGHGSRLVAAAADVLRESGYRVVRMWTFDGDAPRPVPQLVGFRRVELAAGQTAAADIRLDLTPTRERDPRTSMWSRRAGTWRILAAPHSPSAFEDAAPLFDSENLG